MEEAESEDVEIPRHRIPDPARDGQQVHQGCEDGKCEGIQEDVQESQETEGQNEILCESPHLHERGRNNMLFRMVKGQNGQNQIIHSPTCKGNSKG